MYKLFIKPLFFLFPPERAHYLAMDLLVLLTKIPGGKSLIKSIAGGAGKGESVEVFGLHFPNRIGLAAGFDKDGRWIEVLSLLGFGHIEVGTVTPLSQEGNPKPRLFRLPKDEALINRMGFNNAGVDALVEKLKALKNRDILIGGNIGKNKVTPNEEAVNDYVVCFEKLFDHVDYFVVNVSSPNTPGLRELQEKEPLAALLQQLQKLNQLKSQPKPILLKIAPDLNHSQLDDIADIVAITNIAGLIVSNTTIDRNLNHYGVEKIAAIGVGGLSGRPVKEKSDNALEYISKKMPSDKSIIGVGGVFTADDVADKIAKGAALVQIYTGFIYQGPRIVRHLLKRN